MRSPTAAAAATACVACGGDLDGRPRRFAGGWEGTLGTAQTCLRCGSAQVMPRPTPEQVLAIYSEEYYAPYIEGGDVKGGTAIVSGVLRRRLEEAERRLGGRGRMVDVGCAYGLFVAHAAAAGWNAEGVEPSAWAAAEGRDRFGVTIHNSELEAAPIADGSVDLVHANHVLEHLLEPLATVRAAARLLRPGGLLAVEVPQELLPPITDRLYGSMHPALYPARPPDRTHLEFFSAAGLRALLQRAGLEVQAIATIRHQPNLSSRLPGGRAAKQALVRIEEAAGTAPDLVAWARRP